MAIPSHVPWHLRLRVSTPEGQPSSFIADPADQHAQPGLGDTRLRYDLDHTPVAENETHDRPFRIGPTASADRYTRTRTQLDTATAARNCPFAGCNAAGWPEQLARFIALPDEAAQHVIDEYVCLALNPRSGLFGPGKSMITRLQRDRATEVIKLAAARMKTMPWAVYRVRRYFSAPASAIRSLERILVSDRLLVQAALEEISDLVGVTLEKNVEITGAPVRDGDRDSHRRLWLRKRIDGVYPAMEEFYVAAPAQAVDKALDSFTDTWTDNTDKLLSAIERRTDAAITILRQAINHGANGTAS